MTSWLKSDKLKKYVKLNVSSLMPEIHVRFRSNVYVPNNFEDDVYSWAGVTDVHQVNPFYFVVEYNVNANGKGIVKKLKRYLAEELGV